MTFRVAGALLLIAAVLPHPALASDDPLFDRQYGLRSIGAEGAWERSRGAGVIIAVIDTGVDLRHEDLKDKILPGKDFVDDDDDPQDENGHGTHVAGLAAATTGNGRGIAGAAPGAMIMPLRVLDAEGTGVESDVAAAIRHAFLQAQSRGMKLVVNLSLTDLEVAGSASETRLLDDAIREAWHAGAVIVAASGNEALKMDDYPARQPNVLSVGATDAGDRRATFSNQGAHVVAPGEQVISTFYDPRTPQDHAVYAAGSGTSMAAPLVSGVAALLLAIGQTNEEVVSRIISSADDLGAPGRDDDYGYGRVNAARALGAQPEGAVPGAGHVVPQVPIAAEGEFEPLVSPDPGTDTVAADQGTEAASRTVPMTLAVVLVGLAWATARRWGSRAEPPAEPQGSPWEF